MNGLIAFSSDPQRTLETDLHSETSGYFCKMLMQILKADTPDPTPDQLNTIKQRGGDIMIDKNEVAKAVKLITDAMERYIASYRLYPTFVR